MNNEMLLDSLYKTAAYHANEYSQNMAKIAKLEKIADISDMVGFDLSNLTPAQKAELSIRNAQNYGQGLNQAEKQLMNIDQPFTAKIKQMYESIPSMDRIRTWAKANKGLAYAGGLGALAGLGGLGYGIYNAMQPSEEEALAKAGSYTLNQQEKVAAYRQALLDL